MNMSKVVIELEFDKDYMPNDQELKQEVYDYLEELMSDGALHYTIEE
jgi:hypothetical protein